MILGSAMGNDTGDSMPLFRQKVFDWKSAKVYGLDKRLRRAAPSRYSFSFANALALIDIAFFSSADISAKVASWPSGWKTGSQPKLVAPLGRFGYPPVDPPEEGAELLAVVDAEPGLGVRAPVVAFREAAGRCPRSRLSRAPTLSALRENRSASLCTGPVSSTSTGFLRSGRPPSPSPARRP